MKKNKQAIVLRVTSHQSHTLGSVSEHLFDQSGGTFGRSPSKNNWVLPDPERFVSSQHGAIHFDTDAFYLTDLSTNGIFIDAQSEILGKGNVVALVGGEILKFADYEIEVIIQAVEQSGEDVDDLPDSDPLAVNLEDDVIGLITESGFDPLDNMMGGIGKQGFEASDLNPTDTSPDVYNDQASAMSSALQAQNYQLDPASGAKADAKITNEPLADIDDILSAPAGTPASAASDNQIPEDWDMTGFHLSTGNHSTANSELPILEAPFAETEPPVSQIPDVVKPPVAPLQADIAIPSMSSNRPATTASIEQAATHPINAQPAAGMSTDLFDQLLVGLGLPATDMNTTQKEALAGEFSLLFREVLQGLMDILRARAELKNEFRMSQTTIQPVENNPLKFSPNVDEVIKTLFSGQGSSYLGASEAVQEGIHDIRNHQVAMIAGMQVAFNDMVERLKPEHFVEQDKDGNLAKAALQSINKKSRAWQKYNDFYEKTIVQSGNAFQILFGEDFSTAYEEQIYRLNALVSKDKVSKHK